MKLSIESWVHTLRVLGLKTRPAKRRPTPQRRAWLEMLEERILRAIDVSINAPDPVDEGQMFTLGGWYTSGDSASSSPTLIVDWGDGSSDSYALSGNPSVCAAYSVDHIYADDGSYAVTVTLYDDTGTDSEIASVIVDDSDPSLTYSLSDTSVEISETVSVTGDFGHPNASETVSLQIDWGDGSFDNTSGYPGGSFDYSHSYSSPGSYNVTVTATDDDGDGAGGSEGVLVAAAVDEAPTVTANLTPPSIDEGDSVTVSGTVDHPESSESISLLIDWGDGNSDWLSLAPGDSYSADHQYGDDGVYPVTVTATDDDGDTDVESDNVNVANVDPTVTLDPITSPINEGEMLSISGTFDDPGTSDTHRLWLEIDLNSDGDYDDPNESHSISLSADGTFSYEWTIDDDGAKFDTEGNVLWGNETPSDTLNLQVTATDDDGGSAAALDTLVLKNVAPQYEVDENGLPIVNVDFEIDDDGFVTGAVVNFEFRDDGQLDQHQLVVEWGDGSTSSATVGDSVESVELALSGIDDVGSLFPITVRVSDDDLGSATHTIAFCESCSCLEESESSTVASSSSGSSDSSDGGGGGGADDQGNEGMVERISTAETKNGVIVLGYLGRGASPGNESNGINEILEPTGDTGNFDVFEFAHDAQYGESLGRLVREHIAVLKEQGHECPKIRIIIVGHSYGADRARRVATWANQIVKSEKPAPEVHLITIDGIVQNSNGDTMTNGPRLPTSSFHNYYQTNAQGPYFLKGGAIAGATNHDVTTEATTYAAPRPDDTTHTGIDNAISETVGNQVKSLAEAPLNE